MARITAAAAALTDDAPGKYSFDAFELDIRQFELRRDGVVVAMEPQVFEVLSYLVQNGDRVVTKQELMDHVWPERYVTEAALNTRVMAARKVLGDSGQEQRYIKTLHGRGYRFIGDRCPNADSPPPRLHVVEPGSPVAAEEPAAKQTVRYAETKDGYQIAYAVSGEGPPLVRVLGWFTHVGMEWRWPELRRFYEGLGQQHRVYRYDGRGMGLSQEADDFSPATRLADLEAVIDHAGLETFALMGLCEGADTAVMYAARHPGRVSHLITYGASPVGPDPDDDEWTTCWNEVMTLICRGWDHESPIFREMFAHIFLGAGANMDAIKAFDAIQKAAVTGTRATRYLESLGNTGLLEAASKVTCPTLVMHRQNDPMVPLSHSRRLAAAIPGATIHPLAGEARWLMVDESVIEEFSEVVAEFTH